MGGWWVLDFTRLMLISTQVEVVVEVGVDLGKILFHVLNSSNCVTIITQVYLLGAVFFKFN